MLNQLYFNILIICILSHRLFCIMVYNISLCQCNNSPRKGTIISRGDIIFYMNFLKLFLKIIIALAWSVGFLSLWWVFLVWADFKLDIGNSNFSNGLYIGFSLSIILFIGLITRHIILFIKGRNKI